MVAVGIPLSTQRFRTLDGKALADRHNPPASSLPTLSPACRNRTASKAIHRRTLERPDPIRSAASLRRHALHHEPHARQGKLPHLDSKVILRRYRGLVSVRNQVVQSQLELWLRPFSLFEEL